ncbi:MULTISPECIES: YfbM family protein [unclassified Streptomyces]|uniref:YfbM family protein n=1 Tax=unclassified Streptomyces TaxID=2593676 RepID=UPI003806BAEF
MSMCGEYLRVTAAELEQALRDPEWALDYVETVTDAEGESEPEPAVARRYGTYKAWDLLRFLLARAEFPVNVIHGEEPFAEDEDWGYGPPAYLRPERVRTAAKALRALDYTRLTEGVDPAELTAAEVYPLDWEEPGVLEWGRPWYEGLVEYVTAAARADDALLVWTD